jgi:hypothetical protein
MWLTRFIKTDVPITICKNLLALTILQEVNKVTTISAESMLINTFSMLTIETPLTFVKVPLWRFPYSEPILGSILPQSFKELTIVPLESSISFSYSINELTSVNAVNIFFASLYLDVTIVFSLKNCLLGDHYTLSVLLLVHNFTEIDSVI